MKKEKIYFLAFLVFMLVLIVFLDFVPPSASGKITKINYYEDHISLYLEKNEKQVYLTNTTPVYLKKGMQINIFGKEENYLNKTLIFADKITCTNC